MGDNVFILDSQSLAYFHPIQKVSEESAAVRFQEALISMGMDRAGGGGIRLVELPK